MEIINHESYVSLEVAKLLKQLGFDWEIYDGYIIYENGDGFTTKFQTPHNFNGNNGDLFINYMEHKEVLSRPTLEVAQKWLREVKNTHIDVYLDSTSTYVYNILLSGDKLWLRSSISYATYEEAKENGIKKALEMILEDGE